MAGAEAAVESFFIEKPEIPQRLLDGTKFLKWPKADGDVSNNSTLCFRIFKATPAYFSFAL